MAAGVVPAVILTGGYPMLGHPGDARYFRSRALARAECGPGEVVVKLGTFAGGSFGVFPPMRGNGLYRGQTVGAGGAGPIPLVTVYMVTARGGR